VTQNISILSSTNDPSNLSIIYIFALAYFLVASDALTPGAGSLTFSFMRKNIIHPK